MLNLYIHEKIRYFWDLPKMQKVRVSAYAKSDAWLNYTKNARHTCRKTGAFWSICLKTGEKVCKNSTIIKQIAEGKEGEVSQNYCMGSSHSIFMRGGLHRS